MYVDTDLVWGFDFFHFKLVVLAPKKFSELVFHDTWCYLFIINPGLLSLLSHCLQKNTVKCFSCHISYKVNHSFILTIAKLSALGKRSQGNYRQGYNHIACGPTCLARNTFSSTLPLCSSLLREVSLSYHLPCEFLPSLHLTSVFPFTHIMSLELS